MAILWWLVAQKIARFTGLPAVPAVCATYRNENLMHEKQRLLE